MNEATATAIADPRKKRRIRIIVITVLALIVVLIFIKIKLGGGDPAAIGPDMYYPPTVMVDRGDVERIVYATGRILENNTEEIRADVSKKVTALYVFEGQEVQVGDPLYTIDDSESSLLIRKERLTYQSLQKTLNEKIAALQSNQLLSPASGSVKSITVKENDNIELNSTVATISNNEYLDMQVKLHISLMDKLSRGQAVYVYMKEYHSRTDATVIQIDGLPTVTAEGGSVHMATLQVRNPGALQAGDEGRLELDYGGDTLTSIGWSPLTEQEVITVEATTIGKIEEIYIKEGDVITAGTPILRFDLEQQRIDLETARIDLEQAAINIALHEQEYAKYHGRAGIAGIVSVINLEVGKEPTSGKPAIIISGYGPLKMRLQVDEQDIGLIQLGQSADVYAGSFGNQSFPGTVSRVAARGTVDSNNNDVYFEVDVTIDEPGSLRPEMTGDADIYTEKKTDVLRLPIAAVNIIDEGIGLVQVVIHDNLNADEPEDMENRERRPRPQQVDSPSLESDVISPGSDIISSDNDVISPGSDAISPESDLPNGGIQMQITEMGDTQSFHIESREVKIGIEGDDYIEILEGLEEGEEVVIGGGDMGGNMDSGAMYGGGATMVMY